VPSRRQLRAENKALRVQIRLLQDNAERMRGEATAQRRIIADLGRQLHREQQAATVPMPRVRSHAAGGS
jgi:hypothetical protein